MAVLLGNEINLYKTQNNFQFIFLVRKFDLSKIQNKDFEDRIIDVKFVIRRPKNYTLVLEDEDYESEDSSFEENCKLFVKKILIMKF